MYCMYWNIFNSGVATWWHIDWIKPYCFIRPMTCFPVSSSPAILFHKVTEIKVFMTWTCLYVCNITGKLVHLHLWSDTVLSYILTMWATTFGHIIAWSIDVVPSLYSGQFIGDFVTRSGRETIGIILILEEAGGWRLLNQHQTVLC